MKIKSKFVHKIVGLAIFFVILIGCAVIFYFKTAIPYKKITFQIKDFDYDSVTGIGDRMFEGDGTIYTIAPQRKDDFLAADFFYDTLYNDKVEVWVKKSANTNSKSITVYGVECNGKEYLELDAPKSNAWWLYVIIGGLILLTVVIKGFQLRNINQCLELWKTRGYLIALYDKLGNLIIVPCSTTSYLYPNVEMMDCYYEVSHGQLAEELPEILTKAWSHCNEKLANPSKLEAKLKQGYGSRSLKEVLQYNKILYIVRDEKEGFYLRQMKSILPAPEQYVFEIVTEGKHLPKDYRMEKLIEAIAKEIVWPVGEK